MDFGLTLLSPEMLALLLFAALFAGWVDAVVGGGGLIQLPVLLLVPGMSPVQALATNKLASVFGTGMSSYTYYRALKPSLKAALPMAGVAFVGSFVGARVATALPREVFLPIILVALIVVAVFTALKPSYGLRTVLKHSEVKTLGFAILIGLVIGFYDGVLGPGTGSFLVISLVAFLGYSFLEASANAKIVNLATNLGALALFVPYGAVLWKLGFVMAAANMLGAFLGSKTAISKGSKFIRIVFLLVVAVLIVKLGFDFLTSL